MSVFATPSILLVEDDDIDADAIRRALKRVELDTALRLAIDGKDALDVLRGKDAEAPLPRPHVVLLDINLPAMDGLDFLQALRGDPALRDTVVFVLSTSSSECDRARAYALNAAGYIAKADLGMHCCKLTDLLQAYFAVVALP